jgi:LmbE family N-acetylglucosaminyl deacetylase
MSRGDVSAQPSRRVLVLAPHPDDESFGCGGTIKHLTSSGTPVDVAYMTRGERGIEAGMPTTPEVLRRVAETRTVEAQEACRLLGVSEVVFLNGVDSRVEMQPELAADIRMLLDHGDYGRVFCPWPGDGHPDHRATFAWLTQALVGYDSPLGVWLYEVWTPLRPNMLVPVDHTFEQKVAAMAAHRSQIELCSYVPAFRGLAEFRALSARPARYAEAFFICDRGSLPPVEASCPDVP